MTKEPLVLAESAASNETALITLAMTGTIARTMDEHVVDRRRGPGGPGGGLGDPPGRP
jgi:hypothetical protein